MLDAVAEFVIDQALAFAVVVLALTVVGISAIGLAVLWRIFWWVL